MLARAHIEAELLEKGRYVTRILGSSMLPMLHDDRDLVVIERLEKPLKVGDVVLFRREDGVYILHRVMFKYHASVLACGDNRYFCEWVSPQQQLGRLTAFTHGSKEIKVDSWRYRGYVGMIFIFFIPRYLALRLMDGLKQRWRKQ